MLKICCSKHLCILMLSVSFSSWAANPCIPIAEACIKEGYYKDGGKVGKGLVEDCVVPVVTKEKNLPGASFHEDTLQDCKNLITIKMKENRA